MKKNLTKLFIVAILSHLMIACQPSNKATSNKNKPDKTTAKATIQDTDRRSTSMGLEATKDISGYYEEVDDPDVQERNEGCGLEATIKKMNAGYNYHLAYDTASYTGDVILDQRTDHTVGIVFKGIKYAENADDDNDPAGTMPQSVGGELQGDTIVIQNYGNSMNYYVQLGGCPLKYLRLVKMR